MSYDHQVMQNAIRDLFGAAGLGVRIGTGEKDTDGATVHVHVPLKLHLANEVVLRRIIALGAARLHGQMLNNLPVEGGVKLQGFRRMVETIHAGGTPDEISGRAPAAKKPAGKTPHDEAVLHFVNESVGRIVAQLAPLVDSGALKVRGSGKNGKLLAKDWPGAAALVPALAPFVKDGDWAWAALADRVKERQPEAIDAKAAEIAAAREAAAAAMAEPIDLEKVQIDF